jgi:hypothetical protein
METEHAARVFALASRDLVVAIAASASFPSHLEAFARRRGALYLRPSEVPLDDAYWPGIAQALAAIAPPEVMPMHSLIDAGVTLEGGARGLRGFFTTTPSDKERRRVQRSAALAARVLEIVAGADDELSPDERRGIAMAMASFGLSAEELTAARPAGRMTPNDLEIFGELEQRVRRELVRGAWHLALQNGLKPAEELAVRGIAAKLDVSDVADALRAEVERRLAELGDMTSLAVELVRGVARALPEARWTTAQEHLVRAAAPPARANGLRAAIAMGDAPAFEKPVGMDKARRVQAVALAWATLVSTDPSFSLALRLRGDLTAAASEAGAGYEVAEALDEVDRFLHQRVREANTPASA